MRIDPIQRVFSNPVTYWIWLMIGNTTKWATAEGMVKKLLVVSHATPLNRKENPNPNPLAIEGCDYPVQRYEAITVQHINCKAIAKSRETRAVIDRHDPVWARDTLCSWHTLLMTWPWAQAWRDCMQHTQLWVCIHSNKMPLYECTENDGYCRSYDKINTTLHCGAEPRWKIEMVLQLDVLKKIAKWLILAPAGWDLYNTFPRRSWACWVGNQPNITFL